MTNEYRTCQDCQQSLPIEAFPKNRGSHGGRLNHCTSCKKNRIKSSPRAIFNKIYHTQKRNSVARGHPPPAYSFEDLLHWAEQQPHFGDIWQQYQASGHDKETVPSIDRLDDSMGYSLTNIRLTTWAENNKKANIDKMAGKLGKARAVSAYNKDGSLHKTYISTAEAARDTGASPSDILEVINGIPRRKNGGMYCLKSTKGFTWRWA